MEVVQSILVVGITLIALAYAALVLRSFFMLYRGRALSKAKPFEQVALNAKTRVLFLGDDVAVGIGASSPEKSIAGLLASEYPSIHIENKGKVGARIKDIRTIIEGIPLKSFSAVIILVGNNDILKRTDMVSMMEDLPIVTREAKKISDTVIIMQGGNLASAPVLIWPLKQIVRDRQDKLQILYLKLARSKTAISLFYNEDTKKQFKSQWFAKDGLHPGDASYRYAYEKLLPVLKKKEILE